MREAAGHTQLGKRAKPIRRRLKAVCAIVRDWPQEKRTVISPGRTNAYPKDAYGYMAAHLFAWADQGYAKWRDESRADIGLLDDRPTYWTNYGGLRTTLANFIKGKSNWTSEHLATIEKWLPVIEAHVEEVTRQTARGGDPERESSWYTEEEPQEAAGGRPALALVETPPEPPEAADEPETTAQGERFATEFEATEDITAILKPYHPATVGRIMRYVTIWNESRKGDNAA